MNEKVNFKKGDSVLYKSQAPNGPIWKVVEVDYIKERCRLKRVVDKEVFTRNSRFNVLMPEVDLPRRQKSEFKKNLKSENPESKILDKDKSLIMTFERIARIIHLINDSDDVIDNSIINEKIMPETSFRTVQRHTEALCDSGYLKSIILEQHRQGFYITDKSRDLLNLHEIGDQDEIDDHDAP